MKQLRVPSVQHLARNWTSSAERSARALVHLYDNPPHKSYQRLYGLLQDMLLFQQPLSEIIKGVRKGVKIKSDQDDFIEILELVNDHFTAIKPEYINKVRRHFYSAGSGLLVPFVPPLIYGKEGHRFFPWFSFWKNRALNGERNSLFVTMVSQMLAQDPDLETAKFYIYDFSCDAGTSRRSLKIIDTTAVPRLDPDRTAEMLEVFVKAFLLAKAEIAGRPDADGGRTGKSDQGPDDRGPALF